MNRIICCTLVMVTAVSAVLTANAKDYSKAPIAEIQRAADAGDKDAQYELGSLYSIGFVLPKNDELSKLWYRKAAQQGHRAAWLCLGDRTIPEPPDSGSAAVPVPKLPSSGFEIVLEPKMIADPMQRGIWAAEARDYDLAIASFTEAIKRKPKSATGYYNRGGRTIAKVIQTKPLPITARQFGLIRSTSARMWVEGSSMAL